MDRQPSTAAVGWISFAGFVMIIVGGFHVLEGLGMVINSDQFPGEDTILSQQVETWGWIHLLVGVVLVLAGIGVFSGNVLARTVGVIAAIVSAMGAFASMTFYPFWGLAIIAVDVAVIWALTTHGRDVQTMEERSM